MHKWRTPQVQDYKTGGDRIETDPDSDIEESLSECAKVPKLPELSNGGQRNTPGTGLEKQHCVENNISSIPVLTLYNDDGDDDVDDDDDNQGWTGYVSQPGHGLTIPQALP